jgi:hypothetical protein
MLRERERERENLWASNVGLHVYQVDEARALLSARCRHEEMFDRRDAGKRGGASDDDYFCSFLESVTASLETARNTGTDGGGVGDTVPSIEDTVAPMVSGEKGGLVEGERRKDVHLSPTVPVPTASAGWHTWSACCRSIL